MAWDSVNKDLTMHALNPLVAALNIKAHQKAA
jgi:hypothetical protein